ncbi:hypothetical protein MTO96_046367 [Rhipicephalus appendiculatus]
MSAPLKQRLPRGNLGNGVTIPQERWQHLMAQPKDFLFVREAAEAIWGVHNLYNRSITGTPCRRFLHKEGGPSSVEKCALTPRKLDAPRKGDAVTPEASLLHIMYTREEADIDAANNVGDPDPFCPFDWPPSLEAYRM